MKSFFVLIFLSPLLVLAQNSLFVTGKITGVKERSLVSLTDINNPSDTIAKGLAGKDGVFTLKAKLKEPTLLTLNADNKKSALFLDNSKVKITGDINDVKTIKATGSLTQTAFDEFQVTFNPLFEKLGKANQQMQFTANRDSLQQALNVIVSNIQKEIDLFVRKHNASPVSGFLLAITMQLNENIAQTEKRISLITPTALNNFYGNYLKQTVAEAKVLAIGTDAIDFTQTDTLGTPVSLSSFRGKYVLLDFWASWCGPCRQENPNVVETYKKFKEKNFTVLGVSLDRPGQKEKWLQAIHADNLTWTHVSDLQFWSNAVAIQYKIQSIPQNFLVGPDGKILAKNLRGPALESKLCELLGCN
jgi:peroxiredoxin